MIVRKFRNCVMLFLCVLGSAGSFAKSDPITGYKFFENKNQWPRPVQYGVSVPGGKMFLQSGAFTYLFLDKNKIEALHEDGHQFDREDAVRDLKNEVIDGHRFQVNFVNGSKSIIPVAIGRSEYYQNYFLGNDTTRWASDVHAYQGLLYRSLYAGVDLKVYSSGDNLKYDFIVAPMSDASVIKLSYDGTDRLYIDTKGDLHAGMSVGEVIEKKPVAFQFIEGRKVYVACTYTKHGNTISFQFPDGYDACYELVIDPLLIFSTYSGSTADNWGSTATPGENGVLYSSGVTIEQPAGKFPATNGAFQTNYGGVFDIGILKYDSTGSRLLYASYLGGSLNETPHSLVVDKAGDLLILGTTSSSDFPLSVNAYDRFFNGGTPLGGIVVAYQAGSDIFVAKISTKGDHLKASTLLGGGENDGLNAIGGPLARNYGDQMRGDIISDDLGNIYISTVTSSPNFPMVQGFNATYQGGLTDALLVKLNTDLSQIIWSSFLGGSGVDASYTIQFDKSGNIVVAGGTTSSNFPITTGVYQPVNAGDTDGWIAVVKSDGTNIINSTFTGTTSYDQVYFLDLNDNDDIYVYGQTAGKIPVTAGVYSNANSGQFIQKFDHSLSNLIFSTVVGAGRGVPDISPTAFLVNDCNNIYLTGWGGPLNDFFDYWSNSTLGLPVSADAFQKTSSGSDFYFMVLTDDASEFLYGTYMGGTQSKTHVDGGTSRFDKGGIVYHAVCSGCTFENPARRATSDFPTTINAWSRINGSRNCNNAAFKFDLSSLKARIQSNSVKLDFPGLNKVCIPDPIVFQNFSTGGETFEWDLGDGTQLTKHDTSMVVHQYMATGQYLVWLRAFDRGTCIGKDSAFTIVNVFIAETMVQDDDDVCQNASYKLQASGGAQYDWTTADGSFHSNAATPTVSPKDTTVYYITITEVSGCIEKDTVQLNVIPLLKPAFETTRTSECSERPVIGVQSTTDSLKAGDRLFFDFGDGKTSDDTVGMHVYEKDGLYNVKLVSVREFCISETVIPIPVFKLLIPNVITPGREDNVNDRFIIQYGDAAESTPLNYGFKTAVVIYNRWGTKVYHSDDYQFDWRGDGLDGGIYYYEVSIEGHATCKSWLHLMK